MSCLDEKTQEKDLQTEEVLSSDEEWHVEAHLLLFVVSLEEIYYSRFYILSSRYTQDSSVRVVVDRQPGACMQ